ncbi:MAG: hypothetical protein R3A51_17090 [Nannocystaceae bacterium]
MGGETPRLEPIPGRIVSFAAAVTDFFSHGGQRDPGCFSLAMTAGDLASI